MSPMLLRGALLALLALIAAVAGCVAPENRALPDSARHRSARGDGSHAVVQKEPGDGSDAVVQNAADDARHPVVQQAADDVSTMTRSAVPGVTAAASVQRWTETVYRPFQVALRTEEATPGHPRRYGTITMTTALRGPAEELGQFPCTSCHMGRRIVMKDQRIADAHPNIRAAHPKQTGATCSTCHAPDDVALLSLKSGERTTLDHAYRLCAQCHVAQVEAWAGGGHGKRLDGWQGPRVVMGCADCHDPHGPVIEQRIPFRAPRLERSRRSER